jgi:dynein light chain LC8-type
VDPHGEMKADVAALAAEALEDFVTEVDISRHIKAHFDAKYGPTWHCIVRRRCGVFKRPCVFVVARRLAQH